MSRPKELKTFAFLFLFCLSSFAAPRAKSPPWMPQDWGRHFEILYEEYLQLVKGGKDEFSPRSVIMPLMEDPDWDRNPIPQIRANELFLGPKLKAVHEPLNEVQLLLKSNIVLDTPIDSSAYLSEILVPNTYYPWKTVVMPLEQPSDTSQTGRCLVQTIIDKPPTYSERYKVVNLPIGRGAKRSILRKLNMPNLSRNIEIHELGRDKAANGALISAVNRYHINIVHGILANVFPDYVLRRRWDQNFIKQLYFKAIARRLTTTYDIIREQNSGRLLATLGMDTVNYGAVKYFDKVEKEWRLSMGPMTSLEDLALIMDPTAGSSFDFTKWIGPIETLGIEDSFILPRPLVEVAHLAPMRLGSRLEKQMLELLPLDMHPDLSKGVLFYEGRIGEPTKFKIAKGDELRGIAREEIISDLADIFPISRNELFHLWGQAFYTFNPEDVGVALYRELGYPLSTTLPPVPVGTEKWPMQENYPAYLRYEESQLFTIYRSSFDNAQRRISKCHQLMKPLVPSRR